MRKLTLEEFIRKANHTHGGKYNYSKFVYVNSKIKGEIVCPTHGSFFQTPNDHLTKSGCRDCGIETVASSKRTSLDNFKQSATAIHNSLYDYSEVVYINAITKIKIKCSKHGIFYQTPHNHLMGKGCPHCCLSKGELAIRKYLDSRRLHYVYQKTFSDCINPRTGYKLRFDFFIPRNNLLLEYDGEQHFCPGYIGGNYFMTPSDTKSLQERDKIKTDYVSKNKMKLVRITYKDFSNISSILSEVL